MTRRFAVFLGAPAAAVLLVSAAACGTAREPVPADTAETATSCAACHGDRSAGVQPGDPRSAPGYDNGTDINGRTALDAAATSIGAHAIHLSGGLLGVAVSCDQCHVVPLTVDAPGHMGNEATITFGSLATKGGLTPTYDRATQTCSSTYCHGGTPGWRANPVIAPRWSQGSESIVCGSCHDLPPPTPVHVAIQGTQGCGTSVNPAFACHPAGYSKYTVDPKLHMDGQICPPNCTPVSP